MTVPGSFTGSFGALGSQLGLVQLGGPPLINTFTWTLPAKALPLIAHFYGNSGVVANTTTATASPLNRPPLRASLANGGYDGLTLEFSSKLAGITQGNVCRLTEQGGDGSILYTGIVEDLPDTISPAGVKHSIILSALGYETDDTFTQLVYSSPTDVSQMVRDAVRLTAHLTCDQVSVPPSTGIFGASTATVDFRNQTVKQVLDTARSIAGPTWFWHVDHLGRVWFQLMGSVARYTVVRNQYEERTSSASIQQRKNQVPAVGGVPAGGSLNITYTANDFTSQGLIGTRTLNPPLVLPNITDLATLILIGNNVLAVLNRIWNRVDLRIRNSYGQRIHASQPGGAMLRYWEPSVNPLSESSAGSGAYVGPYVGQMVENDGLYQKVTAGDIPVTSQMDIDNMISSMVTRAAANSIVIAPVSLNVAQQVVTGTLVSGTATALASGVTVPASLWSLDQNEFKTVDSFGITRAEIGNLPANGISPAQWGIRANDSGGSPIFDSAGLINVMSSLGISNQAPGQTITATAFGAVSPSITVTFTINRTSRLLIPFFATAKSTVANKNGYVQAYLVGVGTSGSLKFGGGGGAMDVTNGFAYLICAPGGTFGALAAGTYTARVEAKVDVGGSMYFDQGFLEVFLLGG